MGFLYFIVSFRQKQNFTENRKIFNQPQKNKWLRVSQLVLVSASRRSSRLTPPPSLKAPPAASPAVVVSSASLVPSTVKSVMSSAASSTVSFVMPPPTLNTPSTRPSPSKTSSPPYASAAVLSTVSKSFKKNRKTPSFYFVRGLCSLEKLLYL